MGSMAIIMMWIRDGWVALWSSPPIALVSPLAAGRDLARWVGYDSIIANSHIVLFRYIACGDVINGEYSLLPNEVYDDDDDDDDGDRDSFHTSTSISHSEVSLLRTMGPLMECGEVEAKALVCFDVKGQGQNPNLARNLFGIRTDRREPHGARWIMD
jgi:hypothetical protein